MDINNIEEQLKQIAPRLSRHEADMLFSRIDARLSPRDSVVQRPVHRRVSRTRAIVSGLVILGLLGGSVVTAYASEALPGDALYPTKITIEKARIALASAEKKPTLQVAFTDRRIDEIQKVLADVEEDVVVEEPMLAVATEADPEAARMLADPASIASVEAEGAPMAMMMRAPISDEKTPSGDDLTVSEDAPAPTVMKMALPTETEPLHAEGEKARTPKKWKNLEKKKNALNIAIKELERTRDVLKESGKDESSARVDALIENLSALNTGESTPDESFVEKMKNGEMKIADEPENSHNDDASHGEEKKEDTETPELESRVDPLSQGAAVVLSDVVSPEEAEELELVRTRNAERLKKIEEEQKAKASSTEAKGSIPFRPSTKRVVVCLDLGGAPREISVLSRNLSSYLSRGFILGPCPKPPVTSPKVPSFPSASTTPPNFEASSMNIGAPTSSELLIESTTATSSLFSEGTTSPSLFDASTSSTSTPETPSTTTETQELDVE